MTEVARLDPSTHSFAVKIELAPGAGWRSGLFGRARFAGDARQALTLPAAAIVQRGQITYAYVVTTDGHAQLRALSLGSSDGERIEVLDGLQPGERVVVSPPASLQDGARVTVSTPAPAVGRRP